MILREIVTKFGFAVDESGIEKIDKAIKRSKKGLGEVAERAQGVGRNLSTFVTLPLLALGGAAIKAASDSEEAFSKFGTVFKDVEGAANQSADSLAKSFGLSSTAARELLGDTGDLLSGFGFSGEAALDLSTQVNELAVDLASFTNFSGGAEGASQALTKALLGERESVKSLGISILESDVKARVLANTQKGLTFETERQAKAYATLQLAQEQSKNAIGDFARTNQGFANQLRILRARVSDVAVSFGKILLPPALKIVKAAVSLFEIFENLSDSTKTFIVVILGLLAALGPLIFIIASVTLAVTSAIGAFTGLAASIGLTSGALLLLVGKFILIGAAIAAALGVVFLVVEDLVAFFRGENSITGLIVEELDLMVQAVGEKFNALPGIIKGALAIITFPIRNAIALIRGFGGAVSNLLKGDFSGALGSITQAASDALDIDTVTNNGIGGLLGFGASESSSPGPVGSGVLQTNNVQAPIEIIVPPGTPAEEVGPFVQSGVNDSLSELFRQTERQVSSPIKE